MEIHVAAEKLKADSDAHAVDDLVAKDEVTEEDHASSGVGDEAEADGETSPTPEEGDAPLRDLGDAVLDSGLPNHITAMGVVLLGSLPIEAQAHRYGDTLSICGLQQNSRPTMIELFPLVAAADKEAANLARRVLLQQAAAKVTPALLRSLGGVMSIVGSSAAVGAFVQDALEALPGEIRGELERRGATEVTISASLTGFHTTASTAFHASAPNVAVKENAALRGRMEGGQNFDEGADVLAVEGAGVWDARIASARASAHAVGANFIATFVVEFIDEKGVAISTSVHVTWDNHTRDVSKMYRDAAADAATSTSFFLRRIAFLTLEDTARTIIVAVVDAQEELRADVATTCAVAAAARTLALQDTRKAAQSQMLRQEIATLREEVVKSAALAAELASQLAAHLEAKREHEPGFMRATHASAAARSSSRGAIRVEVVGTSTGGTSVTVSTPRKHQRSDSATSTGRPARGRSATKRNAEPMTLTEARFPASHKTSTLTVPATPRAGAGGSAAAECDAAE